ncbi:Protein kinase APK1A, chloroplastic [Hordeum vulgare]|nr:Protein kinase APK1A, chloroplastic [Hordeum vulgare]
MLWTAYFERRNAEQLAATNGAEPCGPFNSKGRHLWWGVPSRTLDAVLEHIEDGNSPRLEYPEPPSCRRRGSSWMPRRMEMASSSLSGFRSRSSRSAVLFPVKPKSWVMPLGLRTRNDALVINEASSPASSNQRPSRCSSP